MILLSSFSLYFSAALEILLVTDILEIKTIQMDFLFLK